MTETQWEKYELYRIDHKTGFLFWAGDISDCFAVAAVIYWRMFAGEQAHEGS
ncbi:MAG: hypothetical protein K8S55_12695 [Phycisphaerae bacterium]|nr:hypothetical protein [Phycisphaerae bacterium]